MIQIMMVIYNVNNVKIIIILQIHNYVVNMVNIVVMIKHQKMEKQKIVKFMIQVKLVVKNVIKIIHYYKFKIKINVLKFQLIIV